ncbi:four-carbon acid sugar kinase family protein [Iocasia frigidifontis]|uniref:Four-carbon acid sugar kinase family protein n=1 Tax=Iocasia fonsfrigidae TaxID=2682810 RepID=A0A8A7KPL2_9FIRM|nr:four-carbon acid sugar kinase family protein [Iocasia fonsfrigidae]QTL99742.1 four-carbon acid sugar kinase family protein [Iocasia fonsfrigidae]
MITQLAVIADDFTGANDTGVQFSKKGLKTVVISNLDNLPAIDGSYDVIVVDIDSRFDSKERAYKKVFSTVRALKDMGVNYIYKKLDSTLRGNIGSEIEAALEAGSYNLAIVAPALPANGRVTIGANQLVRGVPLERTEIANDPVTPINCSYIPDIIRGQTDKKIGTIALKYVLKGKETLRKELTKKINQGVPILLIDAVADEDLDLIASLLGLLEKDYLLVGSAGFAESLPVALGLINRETDKKTTGVIVGIVGSVSKVSRRQVEYAEKKLKLNVIDVDVENLLKGEYEEELTRIITRAKQFIKEKRGDIIIRSARSREVVKRVKEIAHQRGMNSLEISNLIAHFLGTIAKELYLHKKVQGLLLTGGDIAVKSASLIGAEATIIDNEVLPGIPVGTFKGENLPATPVVTKAGGAPRKEHII